MSRRIWKDEYGIELRPSGVCALCKAPLAGLGLFCPGPRCPSGYTSRVRALQRAWPIGYCKQCDKVFSKKGSARTKLFCSHSCAASFNNKKENGAMRNYGPMSHDMLEDGSCSNTECVDKVFSSCLGCNKIIHSESGNPHAGCKRKITDDLFEKWLKGSVGGWVVTSPTTGLLNSTLKDRFKYLNPKCSQCGWGEVHSKTGLIPTHVNHIDGDPLNNNRDNLEILCPNCHSLTDTYGSLNKGSGRRYKKDYYHKNKDWRVRQ